MDTRQAETLEDHIAYWDACRLYEKALYEQVQSLVALGRQIDVGMKARKDKVTHANSL